MMTDHTALCEKIRAIYPDMGQCDIDLKVNWDDALGVWAVDFKKDGQPMRHYLEDADAEPCLEAERCVGLGIEFGQFR
jgi:hypothetical protein